VLRQGLVDAISGGDRSVVRRRGGDETGERGGGEVSSDHRVSSWGPEAPRPSEPDPEGRAGRAVSRVLFPALACPGWSSVWDGRRRPPLAAYPRLVLSVWVTPHRLFGLAPTGGYRAAAVAGGAVGSYPTVSPLPNGCPVGGLFSVALSVAFRRPGVTWQSTRRSSDFPRSTLRRPRPSRSTSGGNITGTGRKDGRTERRKDGKTERGKDKT